MSGSCMFVCLCVVLYVANSGGARQFIPGIQVAGAPNADLMQLCLPASETSAGHKTISYTCLAEYIHWNLGWQELGAGIATSRRACVNHWNFRFGTLASIS